MMERNVEERRNRPLRARAGRVCGYLNDLLREQFPESGQYEITHQEVDEYVLGATSPNPMKISWSEKPTYEFYLKPKAQDVPRERVMIVHRQDLNARIAGGMRNEPTHFGIQHFRDNLEKAMHKIASQ
ncbi:MAG: hypothetical protein AABX72_00105 [Nanoarchaeota archaeon]